MINKIIGMNLGKHCIIREKSYIIHTLEFLYLKKNTTRSMVVSFPLSKLEKIDSVNNSTEKSGSILIAEVNDHNYFFLETLLKRNSSKILRAINVQEAADLCHKHLEIDLILIL